MSNANDTQVGGSHYRASTQHWDYVEGCGLGYLEGCASKYLIRWDKKHNYTRLQKLAARLTGLPLPDPLEDLKKARHYVQKLRSLVDCVVVRRRNNACKFQLMETKYSVFSLLEANGVKDPQQAELLIMLSFWETGDDLDHLLEALDSYIANQTQA